MTTITLPRIDYASGDFQTFLDNLLSFLESELPQDVFNDFAAGQITMFLLRMNAYMSDVQSFKLDIAANENFLVTAEQRRSIIRFAKAVGFKLSAATAASLTVTATLPAPQIQDTNINKDVQFEVDGTVFEIDNDYVIPAGAITLNLGARQGESFIDDFTSSGTADQTFQLSRFPTIENSISVFVDSVEWTEIDFLVFAEAADQVYVVSFDEQDRATVSFGNDVFGQIPPAGASIRVTHRVGGGVIGNITAGAANTTVPGFVGGVTLINIPINNAEAASGGSDPESIESAKLSIPRNLKTIDHAVTDDDYDTLAAGFSDPATGTVAKANAALRGGELNKIDVFIWTRLPDSTLTGAPLALRNSLKDFLIVRNVISHDVAVFSGITQAVNIDADVTYQASSTETEITAAITTALQDFFNSVELDPGDDITLSSLYSLLHNLTGVKSVIINDPPADVVVPTSQMAVLGNITLALTPAELGT